MKTSNFRATSHRFKLIGKLSLLFLIFCLIGCQKDYTAELINNETDNGNPFKISKTSSDQINENSALLEKINWLKQAISPISPGISGRPIYNEQLDFYIDTEEGIYVENMDNTYHSYTFPISRIQMSDTLENVFFSLKNDGSYSAFLIKYNLTEQEKLDLFNGYDIDIDGKVSFVEIDTAFADGVFNLFADNDCVAVFREWCTGTQHHNSDTGYGECTEYNYSLNYNCTSSGGGGGGGSGGGPPAGETNSPIYPNTGHGSGGTGDVDFNDHPVTTPTPPAPQPWNKILGCIPDLLNHPGELAWLQTHKQKAGQIWRYLDENECSQDSQVEAFNIIKALIIEDEIISTSLDSCSENLLNQLKNQTQNDISEILSRFGNIGSIYSWELKTITPTMNPLNAAETDWDRDSATNPIDYHYHTHINPIFRNQATKIAIVRTILHEMIHTYLISLVDDTTITGSTDITDFPILWQALITNTYNNSPNQLQHEIIARKFVDPIKDALKEWDGAIQSNQYYEDLAWGALNNTSTFNALFPIGSVNRTRILNTNDAEDANMMTGSINPKGSPCL